MKRLRTLWVLLIALVSVAVFAACQGKAKLPAPENLRVESGKFWWNKVEGAVGYTVEVDGKTSEEQSVFVDVSGLIPKVEYTLKVRARSDGSVGDSDWAELVYTPEESATEGLSYTFDEEKNGYFVSASKGQMKGRIVIPRAYDMRQVIGIASNGFQNCTAITEIAIPETVTEIGFGAFAECDSLKRVELPSRLTAISPSMLRDCGSLEEIELPSGVTAIGTSAFEDCKALKSIEFPAGLETIGVSAFENCDALSKIEIPDSVTTVDISAFEGCDALSEIGLPDKDLTVGRRAFVNTAYYNAQPDGILCLDSFLLGYKGEMPEEFELEVPDKVKRITASAFESVKNLVKVVLPDTVTYLGESVFARAGVREIRLSAGLTSIVRRCFFGAKLERVEIPSSVVEIGSEAFLDCNSLQEIIFSEGLKKIGAQAFYSCDSLERIEFPDSLEEIGEGAFAECRKSVLQGLSSVRFGKGLKRINSQAFFNCNALKTVEYAGTAADWKKVARSSDWDCNGDLEDFMKPPVITQRTYKIICADEEIEINAK